MGKKGGSTGLKRKPAPKFWPIHRKEFTWAVKPTSGPHSLENCLPLAIVLRDILGFAETRKETKTIVSQGKVYVDGKVRREDNFPVGLMDVISIPDIEEQFRILPSSKGLTLHPINKKEANFKLCRIENKTVVKNKNVQLNLHDGSNLLMMATDPENPPHDTYKTLGTVKVTLPEKEIVEQIEMKEEDFAMITGGKNIGKYGQIIEIEETEGRKRKNMLATIEDERKNHYQTILDYIFALGEVEPLISLPEAS